MAADSPDEALEILQERLLGLMDDTGLGPPPDRPTRVQELPPSVRQTVVERLASLGYLAPGRPPTRPELLEAIRSFKGEALARDRANARVGPATWEALLQWTVLERDLPEDPMATRLGRRALRLRVDALGLPSFPAKPRYPQLFSDLRGLGLPGARAFTRAQVRHYRDPDHREEGPDRYIAELLRDLDALVVAVAQHLGRQTEKKRRKLEQDYGELLARLAHLDLEASGLVDRLPYTGGGGADEESLAALPEAPEPPRDDDDAELATGIDLFAVRDEAWASAQAQAMSLRVHRHVGTSPHLELGAFEVPAPAGVGLWGLQSVLAERGRPVGDETEAMALPAAPQRDEELEGRLMDLLLSPDPGEAPGAVEARAKQLQERWHQVGPLARIWEGLERLGGWLRAQWHRVKAWLRGEGTPELHEHTAWRAVLRWLGRKATGFLSGMRLVGESLAGWVSGRGRLVEVDGEVVGGMRVSIDQDIALVLGQGEAARSAMQDHLARYRAGFLAATRILGVVVGVVLAVVAAVASSGLLSWALLPKLVRAWKDLREAFELLKSAPLPA